MSASGVQRAVIRLLLDPGARESVLAHEGEPLRCEYHLTATELQQLRELVRENRDGVELFAGVLASKRTARAEAALPLTFAALGPSRWAEAWAAHCARSRSEAAPAAASDGLDFARFLRTEGRHPAIVEEIVRYEAAKLEIAAAPATHAPADTLDPRELSGGMTALYPVLRRPWRIERFRHDLRGAIRASAAGGGAVEPPTTSTTLLICRGSRGGTLTARVGEGLARLLEHCDGHRPLGAVAAELTPGAENGAVEAAVIALLERGLLLLYARPLRRNGA